MPQMSPLLWMELMIYFLLLYIVIMMLIYNLTLFMNIVKIKNKKFNESNFNFKW